MRTAFRLLRTNISRPIVGLAGGIAIGLYARDIAYCEMKKAAKDMQQLFPSEIMEERDLSAFVKYSDDNGDMSRKSFVMALNELGVHDESVILSFFQCFDKDGNGLLSFEEFVSGIAAIGSETANPEDRLKFVFNSCDLAGDGVIKQDELKKMIFALLVTRENLWMHDQMAVGPKNYAERKLRYENELQNHKRIAYPSTGLPEEEQKLSIFDEWHRAVLIRKDDEDTPLANNILGGPNSSGRSAIQSAPEHHKQRLYELYAEFPNLRGKSLNECLESLANSFSSEIVQAADTDKDAVISYKEFEKWASKGEKDAKFLFSLYKGFNIIEPASRADDEFYTPAVTGDDYFELTQDFGMFGF